MFGAMSLRDCACSIVASGLVLICRGAEVPEWDHDIGERTGWIAIIVVTVLDVGVLIVMRRASLARGSDVSRSRHGF